MKKVFCTLLFSFAFIIAAYGSDGSINSLNEAVTNLPKLKKNLDSAQTIPPSKSTTLKTIGAYIVIPIKWVDSAIDKIIYMLIPIPGVGAVEIPYCKDGHRRDYNFYYGFYGLYFYYYGEKKTFIFNYAKDGSDEFLYDRLKYWETGSEKQMEKLPSDTIHGHFLFHAVNFIDRVDECSRTDFNCPCEWIDPPTDYDCGFYGDCSLGGWDDDCDSADLCEYGSCRGYARCDEDNNCHKFINNCDCDPEFERAYLLLNGDYCESECLAHAVANGITPSCIFPNTSREARDAVVYWASDTALGKLFSVGANIEIPKDSRILQNETLVKNLLALAKENNCKKCVTLPKSYTQERIKQQVRSGPNADLIEEIILVGEDKNELNRFLESNRERLENLVREIAESDWLGEAMERAKNLLDIINSSSVSLNPYTALHFANKLVIYTGAPFMLCQGAAATAGALAGAAAGTLSASGAGTLIGTFKGAAAGLAVGRPVCIFIAKLGAAAAVAETAADNMYLNQNNKENEGDGGEKTQGESTKRVANLSKAESKVWKELKPHRGDIKTNGLTGKKKRYYQWDKLHKDIEVYDRNRRHLGSMDPTTGIIRENSAVVGREIVL